MPQCLAAGQGDQGQLATGRSDSGYQSTEPAPMAGDHRFVSVCTGLQHSCALEASGKAWCAGSGAQLGQLGTGSDASSATLAEVSGGHTFRAITCGASFTCALDTGGQAWCFGAWAPACILRHLWGIPSCCVGCLSLPSCYSLVGRRLHMQPQRAEEQDLFRLHLSAL